MGCLLGIFTIPFAFIKWVFTSGIKGFIVLGAVIVIGLVGYYSITNQGAGEKIQAATVPSIQQAPYVIKTSSRIYYAKNYVQKDGVTILTVYWALDDNEWVKKDSLVLGVHTPAQIVKRDKS